MPPEEMVDIGGTNLSPVPYALSVMLLTTVAFAPFASATLGEDGAPIYGEDGNPICGNNCQPNEKWVDGVITTVDRWTGIPSGTAGDWDCGSKNIGLQCMDGSRVCTVKVGSACFLASDATCHIRQGSYCILPAQ